jgi:hypothetical protein
MQIEWSEGEVLKLAGIGTEAEAGRARVWERESMVENGAKTLTRTSRARMGHEHLSDGEAPRFPLVSAKLYGAHGGGQSRHSASDVTTSPSAQDAWPGA